MLRLASLLRTCCSRSWVSARVVGPGNFVLTNADMSEHVECFADWVAVPVCEYSGVSEGISWEVGRAVPEPFEAFVAFEE